MRTGWRREVTAGAYTAGVNVQRGPDGGTARKLVTLGLPDMRTGTFGTGRGAPQSSPEDAKRRTRRSPRARAREWEDATPLALARRERPDA